MVGFGRAIIITMIAVITLMLLMNLAFFFPWYLTMVETGFAVSQMVATDNYLSLENYTNTVAALREAPIFNKVSPAKTDIMAWHTYADKDAIERVAKSYEGKYGYYNDNSPGADEDDYRGKPYVQLGNPVSITIKASFPLQLSLFGKNIYDIVPTLPYINMTFAMNTTTTKHYKDLLYEYVEDLSPAVDDNFIEWEPDID